MQQISLSRPLNKIIFFNWINYDKIISSTGSDKPQLSCIRITAMLVASNRLWIGTGIGVVISVPLLDSKIYLFA